MADFNDLKELLNSEAADIARKLDADDGSYDGSVDIAILNKFLYENGFNMFKNPEKLKTLAFIDVVKMIYNLKREKMISVDGKIKVDFDPIEELKKAKKLYQSRRL